MADTWLWGDNQDLAWGDGEMMLSSGEGGGDAPSAPVSQAPIATQSSGGYAAKVRAKWEEIEAIERAIAAKEEAEREKVRKQEEAKRQLAELEEKKRQTKTIAERRRKLEARIAAYQSEITDLRETMVALLEEIERARAAFELQQTIADRRRRMLLMIAAAA
jgi:chromosome segregation ATPase